MCEELGSSQSSLLEITASQGALPGFPRQFLVHRESCPEEPVPWGLLRTSGEQGQRKYLSLSRQKSLGPVSEEPGVFSRVFPLAEVLFGSWEVWLGGSVPAEHTHHTLLKEFH